MGRQDREGRGPAVRRCHSPAPHPTWLGRGGPGWGAGCVCARLCVNPHHPQFCPPASHSPGLLPRREESRGPSPESKAEELDSP